ncbi:DnaD domain protein [Jeotgalibacillus haloalkalitolerans]|uniref:DnaD domain protein n=1 Tax=Jeotgalibacillus haloalkalitolerans TaxID=3104292 RepID=A0ABU5KKM8_9BACL|nr:DnaD domain protein [Jeotgalibacillus sp. HH7-29]MDZ5711628.1 DnaD domain protein [Jeotgalibacillus sp. HH7-29]
MGSASKEHFVKLYSRALKELWSDSLSFRIYTYFLKEKKHYAQTARLKNGTIVLEPEQVITGAPSLARHIEGEDASRSDAQRIWRKVKQLEEKGFIKLDSHQRLFSIVTVLDLDNIDEPIEDDLEFTLEPLEESEPEQMQEPVQEPEREPENPKNAFRVFEENWGMMPPLLIEEVGHEIDEIDQTGGDGDGLVCAAIKVAVVAQAQWRFAKGVLLKWRNANVLTVEQARAFTRKHENEIQQSKQQKPQYKGYSKKPQRKELVPEWFNKPDEEPEMTQEEIIQMEAYKRQRAERTGGS